MINSDEKRRIDLRDAMRHPLFDDMYVLISRTFSGLF